MLTYRIWTYNMLTYSIWTYNMLTYSIWTYNIEKNYNKVSPYNVVCQN